MAVRNRKGSIYILGYIKGHSVGYGDYRYGSKREKQKKIMRFLNRDERIKVTASVMDLLRDWRSSPFENEAAIINGLRSAMCLLGSGWHDAQNEATLIVSECFKNLGRSRPSWEQGQREYSVPNEQCQHCGVALPENELKYGRQTRFCSTLCARVFLRNRADDHVTRSSKIGEAANRVVKKAKLAERYSDGKVCVCCGSHFVPTKIGTGRMSDCCSMVCYEKSLKKFPKRKCRTCLNNYQPYLPAQMFCSDACMRGYVWSKICKECGLSFSANSPKATFCSAACQLKSNRRDRRLAAGSVFICIGASIPCEFCGDLFEKKSSGSRYCGDMCKKAVQRLQYTFPKKKVGHPILTPAIFDSWFRSAA